MVPNPARLILCVLVVSTFLFVSQAFSGTITLENTRTWQVDESSIAFRARISNEGDETAHHIQLEIEMGQFARATPVAATLQPSDSISFDFSIPRNDKSRSGGFPLISRLRYKDTNGYEFTAIHCDVIIFGRPGISRILGRAENLSLSREGEIKAIIKNGYSHVVKLRAEMILPDELLSPDPGRELKIGPNAKTDVLFRVENFSALTGSVYWVPILLQYDEGGVHHCTLIPLNLKIAPEAGLNLFGQRWLAVGLVAFWTGIIIWLQFRKRSKPAKRGNNEVN
jgi:hypothetical protein